MNKIIDRQFKRQIQKALSGLKKYNPEKIILYGSQAREDFTKDSDIDIIVVKKNLKKRMIDRMLELDKFIQFGLPAEAIVFTPEEIKERLAQNDYFLQDSIAEGKVLYEK